MSGSSSRRSRERSESPCCEYDDPLKDALEDQLKTLENSLRDKERCLAMLCYERDEAVSSGANKEMSLEIIQNDLREEKIL